MEDFFEGKFEVRDWRVKNPVRGAPKIAITLRFAHSLDREAEYIKFRKERLQVTIGTKLTLDNFTLEKIQFQPRKNGNNEMDLILEGEYKKAEEKKLVEMRYADVEVIASQIDKSFDFEGNEEEESDELIPDDMEPVEQEAVSV